MLRKIVLIITENYRKDVQASGELSFFIKEMKKQGTEVEVHGKNEATSELEASEAMVLLQKSVSEMGKKKFAVDAGTLYLSDNAEMLSHLQKRGCYTVALYHEGVSGLLAGTQFAIEGIRDVEWEYLYKVCQRFAGEPWDITETPRCTIREMETADVDALYELYSSPNVTRYTEALFPKKEQELQYIKDYIENVYKYYGFGTWLIHRKEDGKLIGRAGFNYRPGYEEAELGFVIGEEFWRQGYAYEVCSHLMELAGSVYEFENIQAMVKKENTASIGLLEKLGFSYLEEVSLEEESYQRYLAKLAL